MRRRASCRPTFRHFSSALVLAAFLAVVITAIAASSQTPTHLAPAAQQGFEVASIRLSPPDAGHFYINGWGTDLFTAKNVTLPLLISFAYDVQFSQMEGASGWLNSQRYDIQAKTYDGQILTFEQLRTPPRLLLEQRFHLAVHHLTKESEGYALVVAKSGLKLRPSKQGEEPYGSGNPNGLESKATTLAGLAKMLVGPAGRVVIDKTGIKGDYDFKLAYATANNPDPDLPDLFSAVQEQLGLKLVPQRIPVDFLVIDHVDKIPTEN